MCKVLCCILLTACSERRAFELAAKKFKRFKNCHKIRFYMTFITIFPHSILFVDDSQISHFDFKELSTVQLKKMKLLED